MGAVATLGTPDGHRPVPLLCTDSWLAHCGCTGSPLPCYRLRGSPACAGATADGSLRWATAESPIPCISLTQMATGGSSHPEAARHVGLAADVWLGRYMRAVSFGWANVHLFAHRCARHSTLFGDLTDLTGISPVQRLIGLTVRPGLPPRAARGGQLTCRCQPERRALPAVSAIVGYSLLRTCGQQECDLRRSGGMLNAHDTLWTSSPSPHALLPPQFGSNSLLAHPQSAYRVAEHTLLHARACHESNASTVSHARSRRLSLCLRAAPQAGPFPLVWGSQTRQAAPADPDQPPCQVACAPELCFDSI